MTTTLDVGEAGRDELVADWDVVARGRSDLYHYAQRALEAIRLIELGAAASLVRRLTGLQKKTTNRLYTQLTGEPSSSGQMPYTDAWYVKDDRRMLEASVIWRFCKRLADTGRTLARTLIDAFESYLGLVQEPLLNLTRSYFVSRLVSMKLWDERACVVCDTTYLAPVSNLDSTCPGCRLYQRYRCVGCDQAMMPHKSGRRRARCRSCGALTSGVE